MHPLVKIAKSRFHDLKNTVKRHQFTGVDEIDTCFNNLEKYAHLYVLSCLMDRGIKAEKAWKIPYLLCKHFQILYRHHGDLILKHQFLFYEAFHALHNQNCSSRAQRPGAPCASQALNTSSKNRGR